MESKEYSWAWVTADRILTPKECELIFAYELTSDYSTDSALYEGTNTTGEKIVQLGLSNKVVANTDIGVVAFSPPVPVYCRRGLYVDVGTYVTGIFVMWRNL